MKSKSFIVSALILALGGFFAKAIGAIYKIPLTNILGSSGMGLYYLVFPVYSLIITICSSGISVALSTEVAKCRKLRHRYNEQKLLRVALVLSFVLSCVFTVVVIFICGPLSELQGNVNAKLGYIAIAPAIILSSIIATIRGYFQGVENMVPTTVSLIIEQIIKLSFGLILAHKLCIYGIQYAVLGAILGVTFSEVVALIIIAINFFASKGQLEYNYRNLTYKAKNKIKALFKIKSVTFVKKNSKKCIKSKIFKISNLNIRYTTKLALHKIIKITLPAMFSSLIIPIITMLDSFMIINLLTRAGYSSYISTSLYGLWGGVVQSLISLPTILIAGVSTSVVPSLSGIVESADIGKISKRVVFFIKITLALSVIIAVSVFVFAEDILYFLYGDGLDGQVVDELYYASKMLKLSSVSIIYYSLLQTFTAILQSLGKSHIPFLAMLVSFCIRVVLVKVLVSIVNINIFGVIIANTYFLGLTIIMLVFAIRKFVGIVMYSWKHVFLPCVSGFVVGIMMYYLHLGLSCFVSYWISMIISVLIGVITYFIWIYWGGTFTNKEKKNFIIRKKRLSNFKNK